MAPLLNRRLFIPFLLIVPILLSVGGYLLYTQGKSSTSPYEELPLIQSSSTSTAEWLTYQDNLVGFTFKYPGDLRREDLPSGSCFENSTTTFCVVNSFGAKSNDLKEWANRTDQYYPPLEVREEINIAGHDALWFTREKNKEYNDTNPTSVFFIAHDDGILKFSGENIPRDIFSSISFVAPSENLSPYTLSVAWNTKRSKEEETKKEMSLHACIYTQSYRIGMVENGVFKGDTIIGRLQGCDDMNCGGRSQTELDYFVYHAGRSIPVGVSTGYPIKGLETPNEISIPNSKYVLKKDFASGFFDAAETKSILFTDATAGKVYETKYGNCFATERQDHALMYYSLNIPFINKENGKIDLTLLNGKKFTESYDLDSDWSCLPVVSQPDNLRMVAQNNLGEPFFARDDNDTKLKTLYESENTMAAYQKTAISYKEYLDLYPLLYWKDPVGRWIELKNKKYLIAAEKCKPVIYLYPEEKMDVNVYVSPNGGFTHTIPEYNTGWHVTAFPGGKIINKMDNATYPYLYWAGWGLDAPEISKGWMVEKGKIKLFLEEKLALLGLNQKEITDFNEYWVARLNEDGAPYYKIMFLEQEEFNQLAPLRIEAQKLPDQVIRVVMYAQPSRGNETLPEQILPKTPTRDGFTVVEWGGSLLK